MVTCPNCAGTGALSVIVCPYPTRGPRDCSTCGGRGRVTIEHRYRLRDGQALREARWAKGQALSARAAELGMSALAYSRLEAGHLEE